MNTVVLTYRRLCGHLKTAHVLIPFRSLSPPKVSSNLRTKILIGFVPLFPSVNAESDISAKFQLNKPKIEDRHFNNEKEELTEETTSGWDRVVAVFSRNEYDELSKEFTAVLQTSSIGILAGMVYGGVKESKDAFKDFIERNQASIFENTFEAKRQLQNHVTVQFGKGAFRWAVKIGVFTGGFMLFVTCMSAYRNRHSLIDYTVSGALVCGLLRLRLGIPGFIVGATLGAALGLFCGLSTLTLFTFFETNYDEFLAFQYEIDQRRSMLFKEAMKDLSEEEGSQEALSLMQLHETEHDNKVVDIDKL